MPQPLQSPAAAFARLVEIMATLRSPHGCPWDRAQTLRSLVPFVLEEAYEVVDAIERGDLRALCGEIGDHLFEGVFLAQVASDQGAFGVADALQAVSDKLVRRHPHVFQDDGRVHDAQSRERAPTAEAALARWDSQKARERAEDGRTGDALGELPAALPSLLKAYTLGRRAAALGFDWVAPGDVVTKIQEEVNELSHALGDRTAVPTERAEEEMGDLLFAMANLARKLAIEPEAALRRANAKFARRFSRMQAGIAASGRQMIEMSIDELEKEWQRAKSAQVDT
jgi:MazG family protein